MNITIQVHTNRVGETAHIVGMLERIMTHLAKNPVDFSNEDPRNIHRVEWDDISGDEIVTLNELAKRFAISPQWMRELAKKPGFPVSYNAQHRSNVSVRAAAAWLAKHGPPAKTRRTVNIPVYPDITIQEESANDPSSSGPSMDESVH